MDISKLKIFNMMQANLSYLNQRQDVLAQNVANANVPGYQGKDLKAPDFSQFMSNAMGGASSTSHIQLAATEPGHISGTGNASNIDAVTVTNKGGEVTPTGNNVVLEDEMLKISKNNLEYQQTTGLYSKMLALIKTAIGGSSS